MATMTRHQLAKMLQDGLGALTGLANDQWPKEYPKYMEVVTSDKAYEEDVMVAGLSYAQERNEGGLYATDGGREMWTRRYTHREIALAVEITQRAQEDNRYWDVGKKFAPELANSVNQTIEVNCSNVLNNGRDTDYLGGKPLFSLTHPTFDGGSQANMPATGMQLSESSLETVLNMIRQARNDRGLSQMLKPKALCLHSSQTWNGGRILGSPNRPGTAENDINVINHRGLFGTDPHEITELTDSNFWMVTTNCPDGLKFMQRIALSKPKTSVDPRTDSIFFRVRAVNSEGWTNWRGAYIGGWTA
jgi:hypothetical protein